MFKILSPFFHLCLIGTNFPCGLRFSWAFLWQGNRAVSIWDSILFNTFLGHMLELTGSRTRQRQGYVGERRAGLGAAAQLPEGRERMVAASGQRGGSPQPALPCAVLADKWGSLNTSTAAPSLCTAPLWAPTGWS